MNRLSGATRALVLAAAIPIFSSNLAVCQIESASDQVQLPGGKDLKDELLKDDHAKSLRDLAEIVKLAEEVKAELEKHDRHVLSVSALKKTEEIEKRAKNIKSRMRRF